MELEQLAEDAAALLMSNASTDLWTALKGQMSHLLSRSQPQRLTRIEQQLDNLRQEINTASADAAGKTETGRRGALWQGRILTVLEEHPEAAVELAEIIASTQAHSTQPGVEVRIGDVRADGNAHQFLVGEGSMTIQTPPAPPQVPVPRQLPMDVTAFTGRTLELRELDRMLDHRTSRSGFANAVISGPAGVGKTGLAIHWAHRVRDRFTDGDLYIDLHGYSPDRPLEPMDALAQLLGSFGLSDLDLPQRLSDRAARYRSLLYGRRMLIVLDNASSNEQIRELLPGSATCAVIITSRDRLDSFTTRHGGTSLSLDVLERDDAVDLIGELVGDRVATEPEAARAIAAACGNHTLALRIAATNATTRPDTTLQHLVEDLGDALGRSSIETLAIGDDPHTDLRAVFSWSLKYLSSDARRAFVLIGLVPLNVLDTYSLAALWGTTLERTIALAETLIRAHLLSPGRQRRYTMHDLLRAFAHSLAKHELTELERTRGIDDLLDYHAHAASKAMDQFIPIERAVRPDPPAVAFPVPHFDDEPAALTWLDAERTNLLAAALWAADHDRLEHTFRMAFTTFRYLDTTGNVFHNERLQAAATRVPDPIRRGRALEYLSVVHLRTGRYERAIECTRQAIALAREAGDSALEAANLANLGAFYLKLDRLEDALESQQQALAMIEATGPDSEIARIRNLTGMTCLELGRLKEADEHLTIALEMYRAGGSRYFEAVVTHKMGLLRSATGDHDEALRCFAASRTVFETIGNRSLLPIVVNNLANVHRERGEVETAAKLQDEALAMAREFAVIDGELTILNDLGLTLTAQGKPNEALEHFRLAHGLARQSGNEFELRRAKDGIANLASDPGRWL